MATITEKSRTKEIIHRLQSIIDTAPTVPLAPGKVSVFKDEVQSLLNELATQMEIELKTYHEVNDRRGKIISEAKKEAEQIIYQAEHSASRMRVTKHTTGVAPLDYSTLNEEEQSALGNANEIYAASLIYTDEMLTEVNDMISTAYNNIRGDYEVILQVLEEKLNTLATNRAELMSGLQEMDTADRSQQIMEIGQLLSSELYMSRMRAKNDSDIYDDGSVQLTLDLQQEQEERVLQAENTAKMATEALAEVMAERDALKERMEQLKQEAVLAKKTEASQVEKPKTALTEELPENEKASEKNEPEKGEGASAENEESALADEAVAENEHTEEEASAQEEEEYEIVYVTEDELEEGEEYEIEYVDEEELPEAAASEEPAVEPHKEKPKDIPLDTKEGKVKTEVSDTKTSEKKETPSSSKTERKTASEEEDFIPLISRLPRAERVASVPSEKVAKMAKAITTEEKYSGLIRRAVKENPSPAKKEKDPDIKVDAQGKEYVQAQMQFDEDFEILEF